MTLEVAHRHEKLAPQSGVEVMSPISAEPVSGACVSGFRLSSYFCVECGIQIYNLRLKVEMLALRDVICLHKFCRH